MPEDEFINLVKVGDSRRDRDVFGFKNPKGKKIVFYTVLCTVTFGLIRATIGALRSEGEDVGFFILAVILYATLIGQIRFLKSGFKNEFDKKRLIYYLLIAFSPATIISVFIYRTYFK